MEAEHVTELKELFDCDYRNIILDLRDVRLADRDAVRFLRGCEAAGMKLENRPAYVREGWIEKKFEIKTNRAAGSGLREEVNRGGEYILIGALRYPRS
jgi:hypothetical protein